MRDDLISRQAALALVELDTTIQIYDNKIVFACGASKKDLEELPTIDAVEVVRCKDCKHNPNNSTDEACPWVDWDGEVSYYPKDDGFCKWGERRDE